MTRNTPPQHPQPGNLKTGEGRAGFCGNPLTRSQEDMFLEGTPSLPCFEHMPRYTSAAVPGGSYALAGGPQAVLEVLTDLGAFGGLAA